MNKLSLCAVALLLAPSVYAQSSNDAARQVSPSFVGHAAPAPNVVAGSGSFTGSEPTMSPRFFRSGTPGDPCVTFSSGNFQYQEVTMFTDATGQVTANVDPGTCGTAVYVTFHTAPFNPASICQNYIWSFGSSQAFSETFAAPANSEIRMVVSGVQNAPGVVCGPFTYSVAGVDAAPAAPPVSAPSLSQWGLGLLALLLGAVGVTALSRRS